MIATRKRNPCLERGKEAIRRGSYAEAVGFLSRVVEETPTYADARNHLGLALHLAGRSEEALVQFREALAINPRYTEAHLNLALVLNDLGRLDEARVSFGRAEKTERLDEGGLTRSARARLANLHAELGDLYSANARHVEAGEQYRKALSLSPDYHDIRTKLGRCYLEAGRLTLAASEFAKVLARKPGDLEAGLWLGVAHFRRGDRARARAAWQECRRVAPDDTAVRLYLEMLGAPSLEPA